MPYDDASFDVASSNFGLIFAEDHQAAATELARVTKPVGGRIGLTAWRRIPELERVYEPYAPSRDGSDHYDWGSEQYVAALLGATFELEFHEGTWLVEEPSLESLWEFWTTAAPPTKALADKLDAQRREQFRRDFLAYHERFLTENGIRMPRRYLLVLGRRR